MKGDAILSGALNPSDDSSFDLGATGKEWKDLYVDGTAYVDAINFNGTAISSTAAELNKLDGAGADVTAAKLTTLAALSDTEIGYLDGSTTANNTASKVVVLDGAANLTIAGTASITGDLIVAGEMVTLDVTTVGITGSFSFEGPSANGNETLLGVVDPTADAGLYLPAMSTGSYFIPVMSAASTTAISSTPAEINLLDAITRGSIVYGNASGASARLAKGGANTVLSSDGTDISYTQVSNAMLAGSITDGKLNQLTTAGKVALSALEIDGATDIGEALVDADLLIVDNGAGGTNRKVAMSRIKTYIGGGSISVNSLSGSTIDGIIASGSGLYVNAGRMAEDNLHQTHKYLLSGSTWSVGDIIRLKAPTIDGTGKIEIYPLSASHGSGTGYQHFIDAVPPDETGSLTQPSQWGTSSDPHIVLESSHAALSLILSDSSSDGGVTEYHWIIM